MKCQILSYGRNKKKGTGIAQLVAAHLCRIVSSPARDIRTRLCVNVWQFSPGCGGFTEGIA